MTPTLSTSSLPDIEQTYGKKISDKLRLAIATYSVKETPTLSPNDSPVINPTTNKPEITTTPVEEVTGLVLLGQPIGSITFATQMFTEKIHNNNVDATKLLVTVSNHQIALHLFLPNTPFTNSPTIFIC